MKKYISLVFIFSILLLINIPETKAQTVLWAKKGISEGFENGNAIVTDDSGNVYVTGQFEFTSVFDNHTLYSYGQHDIMVIKYDANGNIVWIRQAGGPGGDIGNGIGIDEAHNVYVTGEFEETADFGQGIIKISDGGNDGFVAKYDVNGNTVWVKRFGTDTGSEKGRALAVSPSGNVYVTGNFSNSTSFGSITLTTNGGNDIFIVKYDTNGDADWGKKAGGSSQDRGYGIAIDADENVYVTGTFTQSATFKNTTITNSGNHSTFLAKYDSNGSFNWVKDAGDCCDTTKSGSVVLDENGNIYITGYFMDATDFGSYNFNSWGLSDVFVVKYDPTGHVVWAKQAGGIDEDGAYGLAIDTSNHILYVTGLVRDQGYFDTTHFSIMGYKDVFVTAYDMNGDVLWLKTYGGHYRDVGLAIAVDKSGYIYNTGLFNDVAYFGSFTLTGYPNQPWADFYVDKILPPPASSPTIQSTGLSITNGQCSDLNIAFTPGNGNKRIIIAREGFSVNAFPVDGIEYFADSEFHNGSNLGNGNYVIYNGEGDNVTVTGLTPGEIYYFSVFEYNGAGVASNYLTNNPATGFATAATFPINISGLQNSICFGNSLSLQANGAVSYTWSPVISLSSGSGSTVTASPVTTTDYTVTGITTQGCVSIKNFTVTVNPLPQVTLSPFNSTCINNPAFTLNGGNPIGGIYSGTSVSSGQFDPMNAGTGVFNIQYDYSDVNGCSNYTQSTIQVNPAPNVSMSTLSPVCTNALPIALNNGNPTGGTYSGAGVNAGMFNPSIGQGTYTINYFYTDNNGCSDTSFSSLVVEPIPIVNLGNDMIVCAWNSVSLSAGTGFNSYSWSTGETTSSIIVDSNGTGLGSKNIFVVVSNVAGCQSSSTIQITFDLCAGIKTVNSDLINISVYPNPFKIDFTLKTENTVSFYIYDATGRILEKRDNVSGNISAGENLCPGVYFIQVISGSNRKIFSVLKTE